MGSLITYSGIATKVKAMERWRISDSQFEEMGLKPVIYRYPTHAVNRRGSYRIGYTGAVANPQFDYDHRQDGALFLDQDFVQKRLRALQTSYEKYKELAYVHAGPACIEVFGEAPFHR